MTPVVERRGPAGQASQAVLKMLGVGRPSLGPLLSRDVHHLDLASLALPGRHSLADSE